MLEYSFNMYETLTIAVLLLLIGRYIKSKIRVLQKYFIPAPVIGGLIFSIILLIGYNTESFSFKFDSILKDFLMVSFFTTIGFAASIKMLKKGGLQVVVFLLVATVLLTLQNVLGVIIAKAFSINPLLGIAAGSVALTGGHGTSGAFGPVLENAGAVGATSVAIASATYGLVAGCIIGGPVAYKLMRKYKLVGNTKESVMYVTETQIKEKKKDISEASLFNAIIMIIVSMGFGVVLNTLLKKFITLPVYIGPMIIAAIIRNIYDASNKNMPADEIFIIGNISLALFLSIALMTMRLWELAALALPLVVILLSQTVLMALYAYFVTFRVMGKDYDASVMATGHCGFGLGATPNAMANMESFTTVNGPSPRAFFVLPIVGALFIDFTNATIITFFVNFLK